MPPSKAPKPLVGNWLLDSLPRADIDRLRPHLELVTVSIKQVIYESNGLIKYVYFPTRCIISLVTYLKDGASVEMATVGLEGMVGLPVFLGTDTMPSRAFGQVPGDSLRISTAAFIAEVKRNGPLVRVLNRYTQALFNQVAQTTACNRARGGTAMCPLAPPDARPCGIGPVFVDAGIPRPDARRPTFGRQCCCGATPKGGTHPLCPWPDHDSRPSRLGVGRLRMLCRHPERVRPTDPPFVKSP